jgi:hypothetical protein
MVGLVIDFVSSPPLAEQAGTDIKRQLAVDCSTELKTLR